MPITAQKIKNKNLLEYIYKLNTFFLDWTFSHRVTFKCLHKGLRPLTCAGMHKKGVQSLSDVQWGLVYPNSVVVHWQLGIIGFQWMVHWWILGDIISSYHRFMMELTLLQWLFFHPKKWEIYGEIFLGCKLD